MNTVVCMWRKALRLSPQNRPSPPPLLIHTYVPSLFPSQQHQLLPATNHRCISLPHIPPFAAFLAVPPQTVPSLKAEVHLCPPWLGKAKAVSEKGSHRRAETPLLYNGITGSKLLTHQGENLAVQKTML